MAIHWGIYQTLGWLSLYVCVLIHPWITFLIILSRVLTDFPLRQLLFVNQCWKLKMYYLAYVLPECCNILFLLMNNNHVLQHVLCGLVDTTGWEQHTFPCCFFICFYLTIYFFQWTAPHMCERSASCYVCAAPNPPPHPRPGLMEE